MPESVAGTIVRTFYSDATFSAGILKCDDGERIRFRGKFYAAEGDRLAAVGRWTADPQYGPQFEVQELDYELPQTREGIANYLAKHPAFEGIGEKTAEKIAGALNEGESLDELLQHRRDELRRAGISERVIESLAHTWLEHSSDNTVRTFLAGFGLSHHQMDLLLERFGASVVSMLKDNPYLLIKHLEGYGFKRVDAIALKMGVAKTHPGRIAAALSYCLFEQIRSGHTWTSGADLVDQANEVLAIDALNSRDLIQAAGNDLIENGDLVSDASAVTTPWLRNAEQTILDAFERHAWTQWPLNPACAPGDDLGADQREAFLTAASSGISVISGGAGTGKTYVVARLTKALREAGRSYVLCAPTGKAAKRIEQLLKKHGLPGSASTIHRLLGYNGITFSDEMITASAVIIDEVSMVDVRLMAELIDHLDLTRTQLVLVGDHHQLPPVGPGNVLRDVIEHDLVPATVMTKVHRHAGVLKTNSVQVLDGTVGATAVDDQSRWIVIDQFREREAIKNYLRDLVLDEIPREYGFDPVTEVQLITPEHRGVLGTKSLNQMMQRILIGDVEDRFAVDDKVIQTRNDYDLGVMNGTIGFVREVEKRQLTIEFEGVGLRPVSRSLWIHLDLAYALTAHKAQGSEFPCAVVLCHKSHFFADRNWLYTAVTRASNTCVLVGDNYGIRRAARHVRNMNRRTLLGLWASRENQEAAA